MKNKILLTSVAFIAIATTISTATIIFGHDVDTSARAVGVAWTFGLGSIGLFFVGLAFPSNKKS